MKPLPAAPRVSDAWRAKLLALVRATRSLPPPDLPAIVEDELGIDVRARYAGIPLPHPFGKASGQLSHTLHQVETDVASGLAFVVLKTVIAESADGSRTMAEWASPETRMKVEQRASRSGRDGWTVTWAGRGWAGSLAEYLEFFRQALVVARARDVPVMPSVKFHLPAGGETVQRDEYGSTIARLLDVWDVEGCGGEMVLEKDLSPTLAGDQRAADSEHILEWLEMVPALVHEAAPGRVRVGIKLMNALFDDEFQVRMLRQTATGSVPPVAFLVVFNRLFDPSRRTAYGGWDLSERNLRVLDLARDRGIRLPPLSATGNICSGRLMTEYARRGCENGQIHTFFQVPLSEYVATGGSRSARALHTLMLHPTEGLAVWLRHLHECGALPKRGGAIRFLDLVDRQ